eukprot:6148539-Pleurochrysis_carterae.AAC.1
MNRAKRPAQPPCAHRRILHAHAFVRKCQDALRCARRHVASRLARSQQPHCRHIRGDGVRTQRRSRAAGLPRTATPDVLGKQRQRLRGVFHAALVVGVHEWESLGVSDEVAEPAERRLRLPCVRRLE